MPNYNYDNRVPRSQQGWAGYIGHSNTRNDVVPTAGRNDADLIGEAHRAGSQSLRRDIDEQDARRAHADAMVREHLTRHGGTGRRDAAGDEPRQRAAEERYARPFPFAGRGGYAEEPIAGTVKGLGSGNDGPSPVPQAEIYKSFSGPSDRADSRRRR